MTNNERNFIANLVKPVWIANQPEASDRSIALSMLRSNFEHKDNMKYSNGTISTADFNKGAELWNNITPNVYKDLEFVKILEIVNKQVW